MLSQTIGLGQQEMVPNDEALYESVVFLDYFSDLPDPRQLIKVVYPLDEVLLLSFISGAGWGCDFPRHRPFRRKQARSAAQVPTVPQQDADPRPTGRGLCRA